MLKVNVPEGNQMGLKSAPYFSEWLNDSDQDVECYSSDDIDDEADINLISDLEYIPEDSSSEIIFYLTPVVMDWLENGDNDLDVDFVIVSDTTTQERFYDHAGSVAPILNQKSTKKDWISMLLGDSRHNENFNL